MRGYPRISEGAGSDVRNADQVVRDQFARRLYKALVNRGWTQSELARNAGLTRNAVSAYINARNLPTPANLEVLAKALRVAGEDLLPPIGEIMTEPTAPIETCSFREVDGGKARLQVNKVVSMNTALEVIQMINRDQAKPSD